MKARIAFFIFHFSFFLATGQDRPFITTWQTDNLGGSCDSCIEILTHADDYNYNYAVDWNMDGVYDVENLTGDFTHDFGTPGTYNIAIKGDFPGLFFQFNSDESKLVSLDQWGDIQWETFNAAFNGCNYLVINATDKPDLTLVKDMTLMFSGVEKLSADISDWDVSSVESMRGMFYNADAFNGDLSAWDVSSVDDMAEMFKYTNSFNNSSITNWDVSSVKLMKSMFEETTLFNQDLSSWNVASVQDMSRMFLNAFAFNQDLNAWDISSVEDVTGMFRGATSFNGNISEWNVSNLESLEDLFNTARAFNGDLSAWDVSNVTNMADMFNRATAYQGSMKNWDVSKVESMSYMFSDAVSFNSDISNWDVSSVKDMNNMFKTASSFNENISDWDVSAVEDMESMFFKATSFNADISNWDVSSVGKMYRMFSEAEKFNQSLANWELAKATDLRFMLDNCGIDVYNYESTLGGWADNPFTPLSLNLGSENLKYCDSTPREKLFAMGWGITGDIQADEEECLTASMDLQNLEPYLYPVPTYNEVNIAHLNARGKYIIYDISGKTHQEENYNQDTIIKIDDLTLGLYFLIIETAINIYSFKFIKAER